jgi:hypothetical protein
MVRLAGSCSKGTLCLTCNGYGGGHDTWGIHRWARHYGICITSS